MEKWIATPSACKGGVGGFFVLPKLPTPSLRGALAPWPIYFLNNYVLCKSKSN